MLLKPAAKIQRADYTSPAFSIFRKDFEMTDILWPANQRERIRLEQFLALFPSDLSAIVTLEKRKLPLGLAAVNEAVECYCVDRCEERNKYPDEWSLTADEYDPDIPEPEDCIVDDFGERVRDDV
jgi:hypothetical protein